MTFGYVAIADVTNGGLYFTPNFTLSGDISWSRITTTGLPNLLLQWLAVNPFEPYNRQAVLTGAVGGYGRRGTALCSRNGGNWTVLLTLAQAGTLTGVSPGASAHFASPWWDPTVAGVIYMLYHHDNGIGAGYILKSVNYGANWTASAYPDSPGAPDEIQSWGDILWTGGNASLITNKRYFLSTNGGAGWYTSNAVGNIYIGTQLRYPHNSNQFYGRNVNDDLVRYSLVAGAIEPSTVMQAGANLAYNMVYEGGCGHSVWVDPYTDGHERALEAANLHYTDDGWATYSTEATGVSTQLGALTSLKNTINQDAVIFGEMTGNTTKIYAMANETAAPVQRNGNAPNNIPENANLANYGIWVGNQPVSTGVFVYSVEMEPGDNTWDDSIISYGALGSPMGGDRSSFRDMYADGFDVYHAEDVHADTPQIHAPWPADSGEAPVSDGTKYVPTDIITQAEFDYSFYVVPMHNPVTLDADAELVLDIGALQVMGLDVQQPTYVWMGPSFAPANEPTFQPMYIEQLANVVTSAPIGDGEVLTFDEAIGQWINADSEPDLDDLHNHIINEDHTDETDGAEVNFSTSLEFRSGSTAVYLNGLRQRLDTHYTEDVDRMGVTFITPPEDDDELIIDYIVEYTEYLSTLLDSEDVELQDSELMLMGDSQI